MTVPDMKNIVDVMLLRDGFTDNRHKTESLSKVVVDTFDKLKNNLGKRCQYDFGLRKIKQLIKLACCLKREYPDKNELDVILLAIKKVFSKSYLHKDDRRAAENILGELECQSLEDLLKIRHGVIILTTTKFTTNLGLLPESKCKYF